MCFQTVTVCHTVRDLKTVFSDRISLPVCIGQPSETERLSDSLAKVAGIIVKLTAQSFTPEINGQIRSLKQHFVVIQESNQELNVALNSKDKEIDDFHKEVVKLKAKMALEENLTESVRTYDEFCATLESKKTKIKELEKQVSELNPEKEKLKEQLQALKAKAMELVMELNKRNTTPEKNVHELTANSASLKTQVVELEGKNLALEGKPDYVF